MNKVFYVQSEVAANLILPKRWDVMDGWPRRKSGYKIEERVDRVLIK